MFSYYIPCGDRRMNHLPAINLEAAKIAMVHAGHRAMLPAVAAQVGLGCNKIPENLREIDQVGWGDSNFYQQKMPKKIELRKFCGLKSSYSCQVPRCLQGSCKFFTFLVVCGRKK